MDNFDLMAWRGRHGLREVLAAKALGVPVQSYRNWEDGRSRVPKAVVRLTKFIDQYGPHLPAD